MTRETCCPEESGRGAKWSERRREKGKSEHALRETGREG